MRRLVSLLLVSVSAPAFADADAPGVVHVVQDRYFHLQKEVSFGAELLPLDAFYKGYGVRAAYAYHFNDHFAWQVVRAAYSFDVDTSLKTQLLRDFGVTPTLFDQVQWSAGSDLLFSPLYGKSSLMNTSVLYWETFATLGGSVIRTSQRFMPGARLGIGFRLFATKTLSGRIEVSDDVAYAKGIVNVLTVALSTAVNFGD
jgi:outer membrane beta-barrel protein